MKKTITVVYKLSFRYKIDSPGHQRIYALRRKKAGCTDEYQQQKYKNPNLDIEFVCANAEQLPFEDKMFDAYTISFGLRNVPRTRNALE